MVRKRGRTADGINISITKILLGSLVGLLATVLLTLLLSVLVDRETLAFDRVQWAGPALIGISSFLAASAACRHGDKKLFYGISSSALYGLFLLICGMLLFSSPMLPENLFYSAAALLIGAVAGIFACSLCE